MLQVPSTSRHLRLELSMPTYAQEWLVQYELTIGGPKLYLRLMASSFECNPLGGGVECYVQYILGQAQFAESDHMFLVYLEIGPGDLLYQPPRQVAAFEQQGSFLSGPFVLPKPFVDLEQVFEVTFVSMRGRAKTECPESQPCQWDQEDHDPWSLARRLVMNVFFLRLRIRKCKYALALLITVAFTGTCSCLCLFIFLGLV